MATSVLRPTAARRCDRRTVDGLASGDLAEGVDDRDVRAGAAVDAVADAVARPG
jgi:hypothetical protein